MQPQRKKTLRGLFNLAFAAAVIVIAGGGVEFLTRLFTLCYLGTWMLWVFVTDRYRRPGVDSEHDRSQAALMKWLAILSVPFFLLAPPLEYRFCSGPIPRDGFLAYSGLALFFLGVALQAVAMRELRGFYTVRLGIHPRHRLVQSGPYRFVRHPGYLSYLMCLVGIGLAMGSLIELSFTLAVVIFLAYRIKREEAMLLSAFGDEYRAYQQQTGRLIPKHLRP